MKQRWSFGWLALGVTLLAATFGSLGAADRAGATTVAPASGAGAVLPASPDLQQTAGGQLAAGSNAQVSGTDGDGLRVRAAPGLAGDVQAVLIEGAQVQVVEGPVTADGYRWYRIRYDSLGRTGWAAGQFLAAGSASTTVAANPTAAPAAVPPAPPPASAATAPPGGAAAVQLPPPASAGGPAATPQGSRSAARPLWWPQPDAAAKPFGGWPLAAGGGETTRCMALRTRCPRARCRGQGPADRVVRAGALD